jgi:hypothetical protein
MRNGGAVKGKKRQPVDAIVIANIPSQANRLEAGLRGLRSELGLPEIVLDLAPVGALPPHLPTRLSSYHSRTAKPDAYLRDATLGGHKFPRTEVGAQACSERTAPMLRPPSDESPSMSPIR